MTSPLLPKRRILFETRPESISSSISKAKGTQVSAMEKAKDGVFRNRKQEILHMSIPV